MTTTGRTVFVNEDDHYHHPEPTPTVVIDASEEAERRRCVVAELRRATDGYDPDEQALVSVDLLREAAGLLEVGHG